MDALGREAPPVLAAEAKPGKPGGSEGPASEQTVEL